MDEKIRRQLEKYGQTDLLAFESRLDDAGRKKLYSQIEAIDWEYMDGLIKDLVLQKKDAKISSDIEAPHVFKAVPEDDKQAAYYRDANARGVKLLSEGKVAILTVAGGQGSRLGYDGPKGKFPTTPVKNKPLFRYFAEKILCAGRKYSAELQWFIMTSQVNDTETKEFFRENAFFGLNPGQVTFFIQGMMPAIDYSGKIMMDSMDSLALSPNGHGGTLLALRNCGCLKRMNDCGVKYISYFQVDNPLVSAVNPLFIGLHDMENSEMSSRSLSKTGPHEKLGNFCIVDGKMQIIEYSDMPAELAEKRDVKGGLVFQAGSPAIHVFSVSFIERLTKDGKLKLPWHRADKKVSGIGKDGKLVKPEKPNAVKLETFIFDALPFACNPVILEAKRELEFSPVKNPDGIDSIVSCRRMMIEKDAAMLEKAGLKIPRKNDGSIDCRIELSPLSFNDEGDVILFFRDKLPLQLEAGKEYYFE